MSAQRATQLIEAGLWLRLSGDHEGAKRLFEQALVLDPENLRARQLVDTAETNERRRAPVATTTVERTERTPPKAFDGRPGTEPVLTKATPAPFISAIPSVVLSPELFKTSTGSADSVPPAAWSRATQPGASPAPAELPAELEIESEDEPLSFEAFGGSERSHQTPVPASGWETKAGPAETLVVEPEEEDEDEVMDLVGEVSPSASGAGSVEGARTDLRVLIVRARDRLNLDDHSGAMEIILQASSIAPNDPEVKELRQHSEQTLLAMYESKLGKLGRKPRVKMKDDEIIWLNLDHRAGFVLAQIDGTVTLEDVFAVSGMSRLDTARILTQLLEEGVIA